MQLFQLFLLYFSFAIDTIEIEKLRNYLSSATKLLLMEGLPVPIMATDLNEKISYEFIHKADGILYHNSQNVTFLQQTNNINELYEKIKIKIDSVDKFKIKIVTMLAQKFHPVYSILNANKVSIQINPYTLLN